MSAPPGRPTPRLLDDRGCLTEAGLAALARAPVGRGPAELVAHVAQCSRCQDRLLSADGPAGARPPRRTAPPLWRSVVVFAFALLLVLAALTAGRCLTGRGSLPETTTPSGPS